LTSTIDLDELIHLMQVWEGEGVIKYGRKLIGATDPQKSEPGTIRGDLAVVVGR
jgi:nucleoside-diphosphate kinase